MRPTTSDFFEKVPLSPYRDVLKWELQCQAVLARITLAQPSKLPAAVVCMVVFRLVEGLQE